MRPAIAKRKAETQLSLRVIGGSAKGRRLKSVPGDMTRPITDRVKEALFNIIGMDVLDSEWWDMFGGTGAVGIEALSRGRGLRPLHRAEPRASGHHQGEPGTLRLGSEGRGAPGRRVRIPFFIP